jgi:hypothetical protein
VPLLVRETRILENTISRCVQSNLLAIEISHLLSDLISVHQTIQIQLEHSVSAFLDGDKENAA